MSLVFDASCSRLLILWTVFYIEDERMTLESLFEMARKTTHDLHESTVGDTKDVLDRVGDTSKSSFISFERDTKISKVLFTT